MANFKVLLVILLLDAVTVSHQLESESSIIGGKDVPLNDFYWLAAIVLKSAPNNIVCAGTILNNRWVLTAAHCLTRHKSEYSVRLGVRRLHDGSQNQDVYNIAGIINHPQYTNRFLGYDIAVVKLSRDIVNHNYVSPISDLAYDGLTLYTNDYCVVAGWGRTQEHENLNPYKPLQEVKVPLMEFNKCQRKYQNYNTQIRSGMICAGQRGKEACQGDSGDSLVCYSHGNKKWYLVGFVSFGVRCGETGFPTVYTRVSSYRNFIRTYTNRS